MPIKIGKKVYRNIQEQVLKNQEDIEGIKKTIAWFFEHEDWMKNVTSGDYQKYYSDMYSNK